MERRLLSAVVILWGLTGAGYLTWCQHRASMSVLMHDRAWPRPFPYPDLWLDGWYDRIDAENPPPPGQVKMCGEWYRLQGRIRAWTVSALVVAAVGVAILLWTPGRRRSRWPSVRRGVAFGLVVGVAWAAVLGHAGREGMRSIGASLAVWGVCFAVAGAVVGAVRHYPELVGSCTCSLSVAVVVGLGVPVYDRSDFLGWEQRTATEFLAALMNVDEYLAALILLVGYALFWGLVIGTLCRLSRGEQAARSLPSPFSPGIIV